jgi:hypothetical protein
VHQDEKQGAAARGRNTHFRRSQQAREDQPEREPVFPSRRLGRKSVEMTQRRQGKGRKEHEGTREREKEGTERETAGWRETALTVRAGDRRRPRAGNLNICHVSGKRAQKTQQWTLTTSDRELVGHAAGCPVFLHKVMECLPRCGICRRYGREGPTLTHCEKG